VSFIFMWFTSIMEMWLFKPVYIDGIPYHFQRLKQDFEAGRLQGKLLQNAGFLFDKLASLFAFIQHKILPQLIALAKNLISKDKTGN
jgi:hypothetical protein